MRASRPTDDFDDDFACLEDAFFYDFWTFSYY